MINAKMLGIFLAAFITGAFIASPELRAYAANTVGSADIIDNSIQSIDIKDAEVKTPDLANNAVTSAKIKDAEVKPADLVNSAVTNAKVANSAITSSKIADGTILGSDTSTSFMKRVTLLDGAPGWNPNAGENIFSISDTGLAFLDNTIVILNLVDPSGAPACNIFDLFNGGFSFVCDFAPANGTELHYLIINKPSSAVINSAGVASSSR